MGQGHKVKLTVKFTGRQITRKDFGYDLLKKAIEQLTKFGSQKEPPKMQGKLLWVIMQPSAKTMQKKSNQTKNEKKQKNKA